MPTEKIKILILIFIFSVLFNVAEASLKIVEVMYDPEGGDENREWVKLYNDGEETIDIVSGKGDLSWRFIDKSPHYINDSITISPHGYAVLAGDKNTFLNEYSSFSSPVADTTMSLQNTSGTVQISDGTNIVASFNYPSSTIDQSDNQNEGDTSNSDVSSNTSDDHEEKIDVLKIITKINFPKIITAGIPFSFYSITTDNRKITHNVGKFVWNFGDGGNVTVSEYGPFDYVYEYPGDYIVNLSYFDNSFTEIPDATDRLIIKVYSPDIYISGAGDRLDPYVEIENRSKYELDISGWSIVTSSKVFTFSNGTNISAKNKIKLHSKVTNFTEDDLKYLIIQNPRGDIVATYPMSNSLSKSNISSNLKNIKTDNLIDNSKKETEVIDLNNLTANSLVKVSFSNKWIIFLSLFAVISLGIISFLVAGKKNKNSNNEIEGEVNANNFKILE